MSESTVSVIQEVSLESWSDFNTYILDQHLTSNGIVWRGQRDPDWPLQCSLVRLAAKRQEALFDSEFSIDRPHEGVIDMFGDQLMFTLYERFKQFPGCEELKMGSDRFWAMSQHHHGVSPLLDWATSPYVAAFFPFSDLLEQDITNRASPDHIAVWGINVAQFINVAKNQSPAVGFRYLFPASPDNRRLVAQQGGFTVIENYMALEAFVADNADQFPKSSPTLYKILLPCSECETALTHLHRMNINYSTMFPDLEGVSRHVRTSFLVPGMEGNSLLSTNTPLVWFPGQKEVSNGERSDGWPG